MLYKKDKKTMLFRDTADKKYTPAGLFLGSRKISGWKEIQASGEVINIDDTYNDSAFLIINGKSEQETDDGE